jgi:hypothetical protein
MMMATVAVNAQSEQVKNQIRQTCQALQSSQRAMQATAQATYFYDKDILSLDFGGNETYDFTKRIRRNATSGWGLGVQGGCIQMAENFSPTAGLETTFAGKRFLVGAGAEVAISKYNSESSKAGSSFFAPIFSAKAALILTRFSLGGYDNMGYIAVGYEFKYILDKNQNVSSEETYETATESITNTDYFNVEGNSMAHCGFIEARFALKHMGVSSIGIKAYAGAYNRYYMEGSRRKAMFGASVSLYFSGAKKRVDSDVVRLQKDMENGDFTIANEMINQLRAGK